MFKKDMKWKRKKSYFKVMSLSLILFFIVTSIIIIHELKSTEGKKVYFVANDGDDLNDGLSPNFPWRTIGKVNYELDGGVIDQGNDINFKRGDSFNDADLNIRLGGTSDNWMIIGAYGTGAKPEFHNLANAISTAEPNIGYLKIENLVVRDSQDTSATENGVWLRQNNCNDITVSNVDVKRITGNGIIASSINRYTIEDSTVMDVSGGGILIYGAWNGAGAGATRIQNTIAKNCMAQAGGDSFTYHDSGAPIGDNHYLENCVGYNCEREQGFDFICGKNYYIKDCSSYGNKNGAFVLGHDVTNVVIDGFYAHDEGDEGGLITNGHNVVIRNSIFTNCGLTGNDGYVFRVYGQNSGDLSDHITIYNNDFIYGSRTAALNLDNYISDIKVKNNIFYVLPEIDKRGLLKSSHGTLESYDMEYSNNMWWDDGDTDNSDIGDLSTGFLSYLEWFAQSRVQDDTRQNPLLNADFTLQESSPAINAGTWLTSTVGSGPGTTITVGESGYFFSGLTHANILGDNIFVGDDTNLVITAVNHNTNTITVDRSISWSDGEPISLSDYSGSAPDIGAYEFVSNGSDTTPPTPNPSTWLTTPSALDFDTITMTATSASDPSGGIEYYFKELTGNSGSVDSGWQSSSIYTNNGLTPDTTYIYIVQTRDAAGNSGSWSTQESATTPSESDSMPPEISNVVLTESNPLDTDSSFGWINITAIVTDNSEVNAVGIDISCSNGSSVNVSMSSIGSDAYYYNTSTLFSNYGDYSYCIWGNDIHDNPSISTAYTFSMPPNWDIDKNSVCNILDLLLISIHYGESGDNGWTRADFDNNGIVQLLDLVQASIHYGETW